MANGRMLPALLGLLLLPGAGTLAGEAEDRALLLAIDRGLVSTVEMLLAAGSDIRQRDRQGRDALADPRPTTILENALRRP